MRIDRYAHRFQAASASRCLAESSDRVLSSLRMSNSAGISDVLMSDVPVQLMLSTSVFHVGSLVLLVKPRFYPRSTPVHRAGERSRTRLVRRIERRVVSIISRAALISSIRVSVRFPVSSKEPGRIGPHCGMRPLGLRQVGLLALSNTSRNGRTSNTRPSESAISKLRSMGSERSASSSAPHRLCRLECFEVGGVEVRHINPDLVRAELATDAEMEVIAHKTFSVSSPPGAQSGRLGSGPQRHELRIERDRQGGFEAAVLIAKFGIAADLLQLPFDKCCSKSFPGRLLAAGPPASVHCSTIRAPPDRTHEPRSIAAKLPTGAHFRCEVAWARHVTSTRSQKKVPSQI